MAHDKKSEIMVSVIMITYGHEKFIREAIEGVLMQKCNFEIELLVANDCSPDDTDEVIKDIIETHPNASWIKYIKRNKNIGGQANYIEAFRKATGKYIANCEGDDYWIDPLKLQKQVDFLEGNPDYSMCFSNAYEIVGNEPHENARVFRNYTKEDYTLQDMFGAWFIPTPSTLVRASVLQPLPEWLSELPSGDTILFTIAATKGKIKLLPGMMAVYRRHPGGASQAVNYAFWERLLPVYDRLVETYHIKEPKLIASRKADILYDMVQHALLKKDYVRARKSAWDLVKISATNGLFKKEHIFVAVTSIFPSLYYKIKGK